MEQNKFFAKIKGFFTITKEKRFWFLLFTSISSLFIIIYSLPLTKFFMMAGRLSFMFPNSSAVYLSYSTFLSIRWTVMFFIFPWVYDSTNLIKLVYIPIGFRILLQFIYIYFLTNIVIFIRYHTTKKRLIKFIICVALVIFLANILINLIDASQVRSQQFYIKQNQIDNCEKLLGTFKYECFKKITFNTKNSSLCEYFKTEEDISICYLNIALRSMNATLCERVTKTTDNKDHRSRCFFEIAIQTNNSKLCEKLSETTDFKKSLCYTRISH